MSKLAFSYLRNADSAFSQFDCGEPELNFFLQREAEHYVRTGLSAVKLLLDLDADRIVGFYAISPHSVKPGYLSDDQRQFYNVPFPIPAWLIGRLAVDLRYQRQRLGGALLHDAFSNIAGRATNGAGALIIVDAKDKQVKKFYKKYDFRTLCVSGGLKLFRRIQCDNPNG